MQTFLHRPARRPWIAAALLALGVVPPAQARKADADRCRAYADSVVATLSRARPYLCAALKSLSSDRNRNFEWCLQQSKARFDGRIGSCAERWHGFYAVCDVLAPSALILVAAADKGRMIYPDYPGAAQTCVIPVDPGTRRYKVAPLSELALSGSNISAFGPWPAPQAQSFSVLLSPRAPLRRSSPVSLQVRHDPVPDPVHGPSIRGETETAANKFRP